MEVDFSLKGWNVLSVRHSYETRESSLFHFTLCSWTCFDQVRRLWYFCDARGHWTMSFKSIDFQRLFLKDNVCGNKQTIYSRSSKTFLLRFQWFGGHIKTKQTMQVKINNYFISHHILWLEKKNSAKVLYSAASFPCKNMKRLIHIGHMRLHTNDILEWFCLSLIGWTLKLYCNVCSVKT